MNRIVYIFLVFCFTFSNSIYAFGGSIWQNVALVLCLCLLLSKGIDKIGYVMVYYVACCLLSIVVNNIPAFFNPFGRFIQYLLVLLCVSPLLQSFEISRFRYRILEILIIAFGVITVGSFLLKCVGGGITSVGYFGFSQHPNFLGFFSMISAISFLALSFIFADKKKRIAMYVLYVISFLTVLLSAARICLAGAVLGSVVFFYLYYKENLSRMIVVLLSILALSAITFPLYEPYLEGVISKQNAAAEQGSDTSSRDAIWNTRIEEIKRYPIFGVGCFAVDTTIEDDDTFYNPYNEFTGTVELGSTYLGVMSQTGVLGFVGFLVILLIAFYRCWKAIKETDSLIPIWLLSSFSALVIHMIVEGYAAQAGSIQCIYLWLLLACMITSVNVMEEEEERIAEAIGAVNEDDEDELEEYDDE